MNQVPPGVATALLVVTSVMFALLLLSGLVVFEIYSVAGMFLAGQVYAAATWSRK